jgi:hypothetical protein
MAIVRKIPILDIHAVDHCNFHCKGCNHASPRTPHKIHDAELYTPLLEKLAEFTHIDRICIVGGEPTLHPDLPSFLAGLPWQHLADGIRLYTNAHWLLREPYADTLITAIRWVQELCISLHPELVCRITPMQMAETLLEIRQMAPLIRIDLAPEMTFKVPEFSHISEPRTSCGAHVCVQLEPHGYLCRCPQIRFAANFADTTEEFLEASRQADTRFHILSGTAETFSLWYDSLPNACSYCRYGFSHVCF